MAGSSPPDVDGLASTAIWVNCWVGDDSGDLPTSPNISASTFLLSISSRVGGASTSGTGGSAGAGHNLCLCHTRSKRKPANQRPEQLQESHVVFVLNWLPHFFQKSQYDFYSPFFTMCFPQHLKRSKYAKILEREDREFMRALQEEVRTLFSFEFKSKQQTFG